MSDNTLPTWDMTTIYPAVDSPEYEASVAEVKRKIAALESRLDEAEQVRDTSGGAVVAAFDAVMAELESVISLVYLNVSFLYGYIAVDSRNDLAQGRMSELQIILTGLSKASTRFTAWVGTLDVEDLLQGSVVARDHEYMVRKAAVEADHLMDQSLEELAADLNLTGGSAWSRLHDDVTSQLLVPFTGEDGEVRHLPMTEIRNLASDPDREVRQRAFEAELAAWKLWQTPMRGRPQRDQGRTHHHVEASELGLGARPGGIPEQHRPPNSRRHAGGGTRCLS